MRELTTLEEVTAKQVIEETKKSLQKHDISLKNALNLKKLMGVADPQNEQEINDCIKLTEKIKKILPILKTEEIYLKPYMINLEKGNGWVSIQDAKRIKGTKQYKQTIYEPNQKAHLMIVKPIPEFWNRDYIILEQKNNIFKIKPIIDFERYEAMYKFYTQPRHIFKDSFGNINLRKKCWFRVSDAEIGKMGDTIARIYNYTIFLKKRNNEPEPYTGDIKLMSLHNKKKDGIQRMAFGVKTINKEREYIIKGYEHISGRN